MRIEQNSDLSDGIAGIKAVFERIFLSKRQETLSLYGFR